MKGALNIVARDKEGQPLRVHQLRYGDCFGYTDLLQVMGPESLGDIVADTDCECLVIEDSHATVDLYERRLLAQVMKDDYMMLKETAAQRYPCLKR